jgi:hypothetical protein
MLMSLFYLRALVEKAAPFSTLLGVLIGVGWMAAAIHRAWSAAQIHLNHSLISLHVVQAAFG